ncbi:hypothetical protein LY76DRAFT_382472 [Colletotrichum caudatum]|nr:hypothetical protein LY76DRAFT_382472 [Colletotrichum caudatum]
MRKSSPLTRSSDNTLNANGRVGLASLAGGREAGLGRSWLLQKPLPPSPHSLHVLGDCEPRKTSKTLNSLIRGNLGIVTASGADDLMMDARGGGLLARLEKSCLSVSPLTRERAQMNGRESPAPTSSGANGAWPSVLSRPSDLFVVLVCSCHLSLSPSPPLSPSLRGVPRLTVPRGSRTGMAAERGRRRKDVLPTVFRCLVSGGE